MSLTDHVENVTIGWLDRHAKIDIWNLVSVNNAVALPAIATITMAEHILDAMYAVETAVMRALRVDETP